MNTNLKASHPQKYYAKMIFKLLFYLGLGDSWYEPNELSEYRRKLYQIWVILGNLYIFLNFCNVVLANFRDDLTDAEMNDLAQFCFAHISISSKILSFYSQRSRITHVFKRLLEDTRPIFSSAELDRESIKQFMRYSVSLVAVSYVTVFAATIDGIRAHLNEGIPIRTEVTFYPRAHHSGLLINILRFLVEFHWWYTVAIMVTLDCLAVGSLVFVCFKFKLLQLYFNNMGRKYVVKGGGNGSRAIEEEFKREFIVGIQLHDDALWCARNVQRALGRVYSVQVFESIALLVMCLIKLVTTERNMVFFLANSAYILCLVVLTGAYMMQAGDITNEASLVSTAIFHCGWEYIRSGPDLRVLTVLAIQRSQVPVYMTAFGIITLSYNNFISVLRSSYSFFAVMY